MGAQGRREATWTVGCRGVPPRLRGKGRVCCGIGLELLHGWCGQGGDPAGDDQGWVKAAKEEFGGGGVRVLSEGTTMAEGNWRCSGVLAVLGYHDSSRCCRRTRRGALVRPKSAAAGGRRGDRISFGIRVRVKGIIYIGRW